MMRSVVLACLLVACKADQPQLSDAHGRLDATCTGPYADSVVDFFPTTLATPTNALGAPDNMAVTISANDQLTVGFIALRGVTDANGADLRFHATFDPGAMATVRVAQEDMTFRFTGNLTATTTDLDIQVSAESYAVYVRVIGVQGNVQLDSIEAIHDMCR